MNTIKSLMIAVLLAFVPSATVLAQDQSSAEHHRRFNPNHPGYDGNVNTPPPQEAWESKYGAIAIDWSTAKTGFAEDQPSARAARREALRQCGTRNCRLAATTANGCLAIALGGGGAAVAPAPTAEEVAQLVMDRCQSDGSTCEVSYLHCSRPVRIR